MKFSVKIFILVFLLSSNLFAYANEEYMFRGDYKNAYINFNKTSDKNAQDYLNMCKITFKLNDSKSAKYYCNRALDAIDKEKTPDKQLRANILSMMGDIYSNVYHNTSITFDYYNQAKDIKEKNSETDMYELAKLYLNMGNAYRGMGEYYLAKEFFDKAIAIAQEKDMPKYKVISAYAYNYFGQIENGNGNYSKAKEFFERAVSENNTAGVYKDYILEGNINNNLYEYYKNHGKNKKTADKYYNMALYDFNLMTKTDLNEFNRLKELIDSEEYKEIDTQNILNEYPYDVEGLCISAYKKIINGEDNEAQKDVDTLINTYNNSSYIYLFLAVIYSKAYLNTDTDGYKLSYLQKTNDYLKKYIEKEYSDPEQYFYAGVINYDIKKYWNADKYFNEYIKNAEETYKKYSRIAKIYNSEQNNIKICKKAEEYYEISLRKGNKDMEDICELWKIYNKLNERDKAIDLESKYRIKEYNSNNSDDSNK